MQKSAVRYDREGDEHYDIISAYQKSMRGSDPDAALHYLARLLEAGDLPSACRRLMVCASEDVGLAYPQLLPIVKSCVDMAQAVGLPEARIPLADAVVMVCNAPKSNSAYMGINRALADIRTGNSVLYPDNCRTGTVTEMTIQTRDSSIFIPTIFRTIMLSNNICPMP